MVYLQLHMLSMPIAATFGTNRSDVTAGVGSKPASKHDMCSGSRGCGTSPSNSSNEQGASQQITQGSHPPCTGGSSRPRSMLQALRSHLQGSVPLTAADRGGCDAGARVEAGSGGGSSPAAPGGPPAAAADAQHSGTTSGIFDGLLDLEDNWAL
jgi:hypothetical protein